MKLWEGRQWFDESLKGYEFQQMLVWHANNQCGPKSRSLLKQTWYPIFLYREEGLESQGDHGRQNVVLRSATSLTATSPPSRRPATGAKT